VTSLEFLRFPKAELEPPYVVSCFSNGAVRVGVRRAQTGDPPRSRPRRPLSIEFEDENDDEP